MDLINNPEFRRKYGHCKKIIKTWEKQFKEQNGRLPSKVSTSTISHYPILKPAVYLA